MSISRWQMVIVVMACMSMCTIWAGPAQGGSDACRILRNILESDFWISHEPRSNAEKAWLWDRNNATRYAVRQAGGCNEPNPYRAGNPPPTKPKPKVVKAPEKDQDAGNLADAAKTDPEWADETRKRISKKPDDGVEVAEMEDKAPRGDPNCPMFRPEPNRGKIDWDWVRVTNRCSYPIGVLACFFDVGNERDCMPGGKASWSLINLDPGETKTTVATSQRAPWQVRGVVCNLTPIKHNRMLCVLPDAYRK